MTELEKMIEEADKEISKGYSSKILAKWMTKASQASREEALGEVIKRIGDYTSKELNQTGLINDLNSLRNPTNQ